MNGPWHRIIYLGACATALFYLAVANARGYVPFVFTTQHGSGGGTSGHFHK